MYELKRKVHVYETDLMGIVHHSNYIRYCEEARVDLLIKNNLLTSSRQAVFSLTVIDIRFKYIKPLRYGDDFRIQLQIKSEGIRLFIQYRILNAANEICTLAETIHCCLDESFKIIRPDPIKISKILDTQKETPWTETWL